MGLFQLRKHVGPREGDVTDMMDGYVVLKDPVASTAHSFSSFQSESMVSTPGESTST